MELARFVVDAVVLEGRSYRDVAAAHGVSRTLERSPLAQEEEPGRGLFVMIATAWNAVQEEIRKRATGGVTR